MLSYRHAFHAGNHADVLKHLVLVHLLDHLNAKDKGYTCIDSHAGAGLYALSGARAQKNAEYADGIARVLARTDAPPAVMRYLEVVRPWLNRREPQLYPGSPHIVMALLRPQDRAHFFELHGVENAQLALNLRHDFPRAAGRVSLARSDGFLGVKALLPPHSRRGLVLIDPSYEDKRDYLRALMTVKEGLARFADGLFAVWYPCLPRGDARELPGKLAKLAPDWLDIRLTVRAPGAEDNEFGLFGSGMFLVNPPWTLARTLKKCLPWLRDVLAQDDTAAFSLLPSGEGPGMREPGMREKSGVTARKNPRNPGGSNSAKPQRPQRPQKTATRRVP